MIQSNMSEKRIKNVQSVLPNQNKFIEIRQKLGWTQKFAAMKTGYSERLIRKIESGARVRAQTLVNVIRCYNQTLVHSNLQTDDFLDKRCQAEQEAASCESLLKEYYQRVYQDRDIGFIRKVIYPNVRFTSEGNIRFGIDVLVARAKTLLDAFDEIKFEFDNTFRQQQSVVSYWTVSMSHVGEFAGISATNLKVRVRGSTLAVFVDDVIAEAEEQFNLDDLFRQLNGQNARII